MLLYTFLEGMMTEHDFQRKLIQKIKKALPGVIVLKNDARYCQGIPDLLVLYKKRWAMLECKASSKATKRPNQGRYIEKLNKMSFASFIYPENEELILNEMERFLKRNA